jgi:hypothetical protein
VSNMTVHATLHGNITATGNGTDDQRGFDWGTQTGVYPNSWTESGTFSTGTFTHQITGLPYNTTIYWRAKAHNAQGWGYSAETTLATGTYLAVVTTQAQSGVQRY